MKYCIESTLIGGENVELLIVIDESIDQTAEIADWIFKEISTIVKVLHQ